MKLCLLPCDFDGSGEYRVLAPGKEMEKRGHVTYVPITKKHHHEDGSSTYRFDVDQLPDADVYVLQRRLEPLWAQISKELRAIGKTVIAETDDWYLGTPGYNPAAQGASPYKRWFATEVDEKGNPQIVAVRRERKYMNRDHMHAGWRAATAMTVSTPFLAEQYARFNPDVTVLPNMLNWDMWENVPPQYEVEREKIRVGWMGKLSWRKGDLNVLRGLIGPWVRRHPEVEFVCSGDNDERTHDYLEIPADQRVTYPEALFVDLPQITAVMDIGLVPLEMNNFNEAKSDLKGKEYAACGVPCIASPTESYRSWVEEGANGFLARKPKQWLNRLEELVSDEGLRRDMGRAARAKAQAHTIQEHWPLWESYYKRYVRESDSALPVFGRYSASAGARA